MIEAIIGNRKLFIRRGVIEIGNKTKKGDKKWTKNIRIQKKRKMGYHEDML